VSLAEPSGYAVILRKQTRAEGALRMLCAELQPAKYREDDDLVLCVMGGGYHLPKWMERLEQQGLVRGPDFVVVADSPFSPPGGVQGETPDWLEVVLLPSGNPPELEASMEPEVRALWENSRRRTYALKTSRP
jgi:hypothetical protein